MSQTKNFFREYWKIICVLSFLTIITFALQFNMRVWPYSDQTLHTPIIYKLIDDSLYLRDHYLNIIMQGKTGYLFILMAKISNLNNLHTVYFFSTYMFNAIFIFSLFPLAKLVYNDKTKALIVTAILSFGRLSLEGVETTPSSFLPRTFVLAFMPIIIYAYLKNVNHYNRLRAIAIIISLGILYNIHPISTLPILLVIIGTELIKFRRKDLIYLLLFLFLLTLPINLQFLKTPYSTLTGDALQRAMYIRMPIHTFEGRMDDLFTLGGPAYATLFAFVAFYLRKRDKSLSSFTREIDKILLSWTIFLIIFSFVSVLISSFLIHRYIFYMLPRSWKYVYIISLIYVPTLFFYLGGMFRYASLARKIGIAGFLIPLSIYLIITPSIVIVVNPSRVYGRLAEENQETLELRDMGQWIEKATDKNILILTYPPSKRNYATLRGFSKRSILITHKDGSVAATSEEEFHRWNLLFDEVNNENPVKTAQKYRADFIVTEKATELELEEVYETKHFTLYKTDCCS